jgi:putative addiction module component (TIGR02574 family)
MSEPLDRVEQEALQLSTGDRARLAQRLLESLDEDATDTPEEVERAWEAETERRMAAYRAGQAIPLPSTHVVEEARARLRKS